MAVTARRKVMLTARDACAAKGVQVIWNHFKDDAALELVIVTQGVAADILASLKIPTVEIELPAVSDKNDPVAARLLEQAAQLLKQYSPDLVIAGLSTPPTAGIDEAVIVEAQTSQNRRIPTYMVQDFWGDTNLFYGKHPDTYLAMDEQGVIETRRRHGRESEVLGSLRHAPYKDLDIGKLRKSARWQFEFSNNELVHTLFCQPLFHIPGYLLTIQDWAKALPKSSRVLYRPHPATGDSDRDQVTSLLHELRLSFQLADRISLEETIAASDSMASVLSNAAVDAVYLNRFSPVPIGVPVYLLQRQDVREAMSTMLNLENLPLVKMDLALQANDQDSVRQKIFELENEVVRSKIWQASQNLPNPAMALQKLEEILKRHAV